MKMEKEKERRVKNYQDVRHKVAGKAEREREEGEEEDEEGRRRRRRYRCVS